ncbi:hypothetical protein D3C73_687940 [compost metagenome]
MIKGIYKNIKSSREVYAEKVNNGVFFQDIRSGIHATVTLEHFNKHFVFDRLLKV